jgi:hypothetical protein
VVAVDDEAKKARLSLAQAEILKSLARDEALWKEKRSGPAHGKEHEGEEPPHFHPEFGRFMLEATPGRPWGIDFKDLLKVESNMKWRCVCYCHHEVFTVTNCTVQARDCKVSHGAERGPHHTYHVSSSRNEG